MSPRHALDLMFNFLLVKQNLLRDQASKTWQRRITCPQNLLEHHIVSDFLGSCEPVSCSWCNQSNDHCIGLRESARTRFHEVPGRRQQVPWAPGPSWLVRQRDSFKLARPFSRHGFSFEAHVLQTCVNPLEARFFFFFSSLHSSKDKLIANCIRDDPQSRWLAC